MISSPFLKEKIAVEDAPKPLSDLSLEEVRAALVAGIGPEAAARVAAIAEADAIVLSDEEIEAELHATTPSYVADLERERHQENLEIARWRREWEADQRPEHSCLQESVSLLSGRSACGVCGALIVL